MAKSIVKVAGLTGSLGRCFHIDNPKVFRFSDFFICLQKYGFAVEFVDYLEWRQLLMNLTMSSKSNALYPLLHFVLDDLPTASKSPALQSSNFRGSLVGTGLECPSTVSVMGTYMAYLVATKCVYVALHSLIPSHLVK